MRAATFGTGLLTPARSARLIGGSAKGNAFNLTLIATLSTLPTGSASAATEGMTSLNTKMETVLWLESPASTLPAILLPQLTKAAKHGMAVYVLNALRTGPLTQREFVNKYQIAARPMMDSPARAAITDSSLMQESVSSTPSTPLLHLMLAAKIGTGSIKSVKPVLPTGS